MISSWFYFAENSVENIEFAKSLDVSNGTYLFWGDLDKVKPVLYKGLENVKFIERDDNDDIFKRHLYKKIRENVFAPEFAVIKVRSIFDSWVLASLNREKLMDCRCFSIFNDFGIPLSGDELMLIDDFCLNFVLGVDGVRKSFFEVMSKMDNLDVQNIMKKISLIEGFCMDERELISEEVVLKIKKGILGNFEKKDTVMAVEI